MKNKFLIVLLSLLALIQGHGLYRCLNTIYDYWGTTFKEILSTYTVNAIYYVCTIILCVFIVVCLIKKTNFTNSVRYTYEQYKEMRQKKKAEKQKAMKEKLQKQLNELEKD